MTFQMTELPMGILAEGQAHVTNASQVLPVQPGPVQSNTTKSTGIVVPLAFFASIGLFCLFVFCCVRSLFKDIYLPRMYMEGSSDADTDESDDGQSQTKQKQRRPRLPYRLSQGFIGWIPTLIHNSEGALVQSLGLDSVIFLRFLWMGVKLFGILSLLGLCLLVPVNYYSQEPNFTNSTGYLYEDVLLPSLSVLNVPNRSPFLWVHLLFTWIFSLLAIGFLIAFYREALYSKLKYEAQLLRDSNLSRIDSRSIMVFGVPRDLRGEVELAAYFEGLGLGKVENVVMCRKWSKLKRAVQLRAHFLGKLERVYSDVMAQNTKRARSRTNTEGPLSSGIIPEQLNNTLLLSDDPFNSEDTDRILSEMLARVFSANRPHHRTGFLGCFGQKVDSLEYYLDQFKYWHKEAIHLRKHPENSPPTSVGFVTFESPLSAAIASQAVLHRRPFACMTRMAPEPRDIYWPNLSSEAADSSIKLFRSIIVMGSLLFLVFSSTAIVSTFAGLIDLKQLAVYIPGLKDIFEGLPEAWIQLIQGVIPTILVAAWTSSLPAVLLVLSRMQGIETESWIEMSVMSKYFFYQLWNVLFVQVLVRAVLYELVLNPREFIEVLGQMVPKASPTLINYVMLQATAVYPAQLLLVGPLILTWLTRLAPWSDSSPRQRSDAYYPSILTCINFGISYPIPMLMFVIGITYAPIAPLILPFCTLFFGIAYFVHKYMFLYVHIPRYENKARAVPLIVNRCLAGLIIMQLTMMGLLALKAIGGDEDRHQSLRLLAKQPGWSAYAQMVFGVGPLLLITLGVYWWLKQGYEKEIERVPLEVISKVIREMRGSPHGVTQQDDRLPRTPEAHDSMAFEGQELADVQFGAVSSSLSSSSGLRSSSSLLNIIVEGEEGLGDGLPTTETTSSTLLSVSAGRSRAGSVSRPDYDELAAKLLREEEGMGSPLLVAEGQPLLGEGAPRRRRRESVEAQRVLKYHLEPPMTRVPGVLDAPISLDPLGCSPDQDLQNDSYLHPALMGRLPTFWVPSEVQPVALERLREEQGKRQRLGLKRFLGRQRIGVRAMEEEEEALRRERRERSGTTLDGGSPRRGGGGRRLGPLGRVRNFLDGLTAWVHLSLS